LPSYSFVLFLSAFFTDSQSLFLIISSLTLYTFLNSFFTLSFSYFLLSLSLTHTYTHALFCYSLSHSFLICLTLFLSHSFLLCPTHFLTLSLSIYSHTLSHSVSLTSFLPHSLFTLSLSISVSISISVLIS
jgi:hypothetical protein